MSPGRNRFHSAVRWLFVVFGLLTVLAAYGWFHRTIVEPRRHSAAVERHLDSLSTRSPTDMTPQQWEVAVVWIHNLHHNSLIMFEAGGPEISRFEQRLADKLAGDVNMGTIHWIWDEYAAICPGGHRYQKFKPQMIEEIEHYGPIEDGRGGL